MCIKFLPSQQVLFLRRLRSSAYIRTWEQKSFLARPLLSLVHTYVDRYCVDLRQVWTRPASVAIGRRKRRDEGIGGMFFSHVKIFFSFFFFSFPWRGQNADHTNPSPPPPRAAAAGLLDRFPSGMLKRRTSLHAMYNYRTRSKRMGLQSGCACTIYAHVRPRRVGYQEEVEEEEEEQRPSIHP